jgi:hypothetical protein
MNIKKIAGSVALLAMFVAPLSESRKSRTRLGRRGRGRRSTGITHVTTRTRR